MKCTGKIWAWTARSAIRERISEIGRRCHLGPTAWTATVCRFRNLRKSKDLRSRLRTHRSVLLNLKAGSRRTSSFRTGFTQGRTSLANHATVRLPKSTRVAGRMSGCGNAWPAIGASADLRTLRQIARGAIGEDFARIVPEAFGRRSRFDFPLWLSPGKILDKKCQGFSLESRYFALGKGTEDFARAKSENGKAGPNPVAGKASQVSGFDGAAWNGYRPGPLRRLRKVRSCLYAGKQRSARERGRGSEGALYALARNARKRSCHVRALRKRALRTGLPDGSRRFQPGRLFGDGLSAMHRNALLRSELSAACPKVQLCGCDARRARGKVQPGGSLAPAGCHGKMLALHPPASECAGAFADIWRKVERGKRDDRLCGCVPKARYPLWKLA